MISNPKSVGELIRAEVPDVPAGRQPVRILVCGKPQGVDHTVRRLHVLGFAEVWEWSPILPSPVEGEGIRLLTRYYRVAG
jgi:hypothetical protein